MKDDNIFLNFLYLLSKNNISNSLYLEGGFCLSFIYGIDRVFSQDIDFTIDDIGKREELLIVATAIIPKVIKGEILIGENSIKISDGDKQIFQIDFYPLGKEFFYWEKKELVYKKNKFVVRVHSLEDIFAEKISNVFQNDRCEFKDIVDINAIYAKLKVELDEAKFKKYLHGKLFWKKVDIKIKNNPLFLVLDREISFKKSYSIYAAKDSLNFSSQFNGACRIIENFL